MLTLFKMRVATVRSGWTAWVCSTSTASASASSKVGRATELKWERAQVGTEPNWEWVAVGAKPKWEPSKEMASASAVSNVVAAAKFNKMVLLQHRCRRASLESARRRVLLPKWELSLSGN